MLLRIDLVSAVPDSFQSILSTSILQRAQEKGVVEIVVHNLHDYANDTYKHIDDTPFGGGAGMIIQCQPIFDCIEKLTSEREYDHIIYLTPDGEQLTQGIANELSLSKNLLMLAGHYKGIDQRVRDRLITREISIGDYVLSGGELPALVLTDSIVRVLPGAIGDSTSALDDSYQDNLLAPPQYTRPAVFRDMKVPDVLLSGNHKKIAEWKMEESLNKTRQRRPDLLDNG